LALALAAAVARTFLALDSSPSTCALPRAFSVARAVRVDDETSFFLGACAERAVDAVVDDVDAVAAVVGAVAEEEAAGRTGFLVTAGGIHAPVGAGIVPAAPEPGSTTFVTALSGAPKGVLGAGGSAASLSSTDAGRSPTPGAALTGLSSAWLATRLDAVRCSEPAGRLAAEAGAANAADGRTAAGDDAGAPAAGDAAAEPRCGRQLIGRWSDA